MAPCVDGDLVTSHILFDEDIRAFDNARTDNKESCMEVFLVQVR